MTYWADWIHISIHDLQSQTNLVWSTKPDKASSAVHSTSCIIHKLTLIFLKEILQVCFSQIFNSHFTLSLTAHDFSPYYVEHIEAIYILFSLYISSRLLICVYSFLPFQWGDLSSIHQTLVPIQVSWILSPSYFCKDFPLQFIYHTKSSDSIPIVSWPTTFKHVSVSVIFRTKQNTKRACARAHTPYPPFLLLFISILSNAFSFIHEYSFILQSLRFFRFPVLNDSRCLLLALSATLKQKQLLCPTRKIFLFWMNDDNIYSWLLSNAVMLLLKLIWVTLHCLPRCESYFVITTMSSYFIVSKYEHLVQISHMLTLVTYLSPLEENLTISNSNSPESRIQVQVHDKVYCQLSGIFKAEFQR